MPLVNYTQMYEKQNTKSDDQTTYRQGKTLFNVGEGKSLIK